MNLYKLTDRNGFTRHSMKLEAGKSYKVLPCDNPRLYRGDVIQAYKNLNFALLVNTSHSNYKNPLLWCGEGEVVVSDYFNAGVFELKNLKKINPPNWMAEKKESMVLSQFSVLCADLVIPLFEKQFPNNDCLRVAIQAAIAHIQDPNPVTADKLAKAEIAANTAAIEAERLFETSNEIIYLYAGYAAEAVIDACFNAAHSNSNTNNSELCYANTAYSYAASVIHIISPKIDFGELADRAVQTIKEKP